MSGEKRAAEVGGELASRRPERSAYERERGASATERATRMRIGMPLSYAGGFEEAAQEVGVLERAGLDIVFVPEAYSFDAVSQLGFLAARTERIQLASGILQIYTRTPTLTAMTAAGLDYVSGGRFVLGLGASGPQVIEGFHGVPYDAPLGRTREIVDICRQVWRRERVQYAGKHYQIPLPADRGTGLGKPLKLINQPVRERIPILIAALGPKNVAMTAEIAEAWEPIFYYPEKAESVWGAPLAEGLAKRDPALGPLDVCVGTALAIGDDAESALAGPRAELALYLGGMGARGKNFYYSLAERYGFGEDAARIQDLYLAGRKEEAAAAVPDELVRNTSLIGDERFIGERLRAYVDAGVTTLAVKPVAADAAGRLAQLERLRALLP